MSLNDYKCRNCGYIAYDVLDPRKELDKCPKCGFMDWEKTLPSRLSIRFKGDGFYKNEYKKKFKDGKPKF